MLCVLEALLGMIKFISYFIRNLGGTAGGSLLEVLLLRDCMHLKEVRVVN